MRIRALWIFKWYSMHSYLKHKAPKLVWMPLFFCVSPSATVLLGTSRCQSSVYKFYTSHNTTESIILVHAKRLLFPRSSSLTIGRIFFNGCTNKYTHKLTHAATVFLQFSSSTLDRQTARNKYCANALTYTPFDLGCLSVLGTCFPSQSPRGEPVWMSSFRASVW